MERPISTVTRISGTRRIPANAPQRVEYPPLRRPLARVKIRRPPPIRTNGRQIIR